jgi:hypothetical protein
VSNHFARSIFPSVGPGKQEIPIRWGNRPSEYAREDRYAKGPVNMQNEPLRFSIPFREFQKDFHFPHVCRRRLVLRTDNFLLVPAKKPTEASLLNSQRLADFRRVSYTF